MNYFFYNLFRKTSSINLLLGGSLFVLGGSCYSLYNNICNLLNNNGYLILHSGMIGEEMNKIDNYYLE